MYKSTFALSFVSVFVLAFATDISEIVFGNLDDSVPAAYGDFNSDELTDVFVLRDDFSTIEILLASDVDQLLQPRKLSCHYPGKQITSIVPGDFDGDALMDVMHTVKLDDKNLIGVFVSWGDFDHLNCSDGNDPLIKMLGEPLALDYNSDMVIDLFGMDEDWQRTFWVFEKGRRGMVKKIPLVHHPKSNQTLPKMSIPHSHSYLDLNDDFDADLFITTEENTAEIWLATDESEGARFQLNRTIRYDPPGSTDRRFGQSIFIDMELNGKLNQLLPVCNDKDCQNSTIWVQSGEHYHDLQINFQDDNKTLWGFLPPEESHLFGLISAEDNFYSKAITLRSGDFNNDGYPDLLVTLKSSKGSIQTFLMENVKDVNARPSDHFKRTFVVRWTALSPFGDNTVMGSFYDFYQDGILDVILLQKNGKKFKPLAFRNTLDYDANFVKVIVLTGLSNKRPPAKETPFGPKKRNYGTNLPGPRIKYYTTTQEGTPQHGGSCQLPQSAYFSLHLPYTIFGLGRTPNFVDFIEIGLEKKSRQWPQTIPNSQIFVIPSSQNPQNWKIQLFVTPSKIILKSVFALLGICFVILLIIMGLHLKERREDKLEKLQEAQRFHFDAM